MTFDIVSKFCIKMFLALYYILKEAQAHLSRQKKNNTEYIVVRNYTIGCSIIIWTGLNIKIGIVQKVYE